MSEKSNQEQEQLLSPGEILKEARERMSLSQSEVAEKLRLSLQSIKDIEENRYHQYEADVYVRLHMRSFARIVCIPESQVLESYNRINDQDKFQGGNKPVLQQPVAVLAHEVTPRRRRLVWWFGGFILLALVILVVMWWQGQSSHVYSSAAEIQSQLSVPMQQIAEQTKKAEKLTRAKLLLKKHTTTKKKKSIALKKVNPKIESAPKHQEKVVAKKQQPKEPLKPNYTIE